MLHPERTVDDRVVLIGIPERTAVVVNRCCVVTPAAMAALCDPVANGLIYDLFLVPMVPSGSVAMRPAK